VIPSLRVALATNSMAGPSVDRAQPLAQLRREAFGVVGEIGDHLTPQEHA